MNIRDLLTVFSFEVKDKPLDLMEKKLGQIQHTLEFLAATEIVKGIVDMTEKFAHFAEEIHVASEAAGITVEAFQKLAFAAGQSAVSQDEMGMAMARLSRHLYDARKGGSEAQKAFALAGFTAEQVSRFHTGSDAMLALADKFSGIKDPIAKQGIAMELLGRNSINMVSFLSKGSGAIKGMGLEAERLGIILSTKQINALVNVEHALQKVWAIFKAFGATIATYLAPIMESAIKNFTDFYQANHKVLEQNISKWAEDVAYALGYLHGLVQGIVIAFLEFAKTHQVLIRHVFEFVTALMTVAGVLYLVQKAVGLVKLGFELLLWPLRLVGTIFGSTIGLWAIAIAGIIIAVHDLWNGIQGKPTWLGSFFKFLGIANQVQDVCFAIFDIISDILNLDFSKLLGDVVGDAKGVGAWLYGLGAKVGLFGDAAANLNSAQAANATPAIPGATTSTSVGGSSSSIQAPITINVPPGTDPKEVGKQVKEGVREHLDRVHREAHRSLRAVEAY